MVYLEGSSKKRGEGAGSDLPYKYGNYFAIVHVSKGPRSYYVINIGQVSGIAVYIHVASSMQTLEDISHGICSNFKVRHGTL